MRAEYKREDFAKLERGKFFNEVAKGRAVALIAPGKKGRGSTNLKEPANEQQTSLGHQRP